MSAIVSRAFEHTLTESRSQREFIETVLLKVDGEPLHFATDAQTGALTGNPGYDQEALAQVRGAIVKIETDTNTDTGSGFITTDPDGKQVIVTAAHVVGEHELSSIVMTDIAGRQTTPTHGRYIFEGQGALSEGLVINFPEIDLAVLRPQDPLGDTSLRIGTLAARGTWLDMMNYQGKVAFDQPHTYKTIALTNRPGTTNLALSGVEPERKHEPPASYIAHGGASGSVMFDAQRNEVAGVACFGGTRLLRSQDLDALKVSFDQPLGEISGIYALPLRFVDPAYIHEAIRALPNA